jgi:Protein of unknown function (DUF1460)
MKRYFFKLLFLLMVIHPSFGQFNENTIKQLLSNPKETSLAKTLLQIGKTFEGVPYEGGTLEGPEEKLVCKIDAFDCYTFVENVLAISLTKVGKEKHFDRYMEHLQSLRYREGKIEGYTSRIHYFLEWAKLAQKNKILHDLTPVFGSKIDKKINFMSKNRHYYPSFAKDNEVLQEVLEMEKGVAKYGFYLIPKADFKTFKQLIKDGDIIAFTSATPGLDVNHEGFAIWQNNDLYLLHASAEKKKVVLSEETLESYLFRIKKHSGIMLLRVIEPKG